MYLCLVVLVLPSCNDYMTLKHSSVLHFCVKRSYVINIYDPTEHNRPIFGSDKSTSATCDKNA